MTQTAAVLARPSVSWNPPRTTTGRGPRILIAEDEASLRAYIDRVLRGADYLTARAIDGLDALAMAKQLGPFDMLVTDELMPRMLGHELAHHLRKQNPYLRVLYVTAYSHRLVEEKPAWEKHEARLEKPVTPAQLLEAVSCLLRPEAADGNTAFARAAAVRIHGEFSEMPGLVLTLAEAARFFHLPPAVCHAAFEHMVEAGLLCQRPDGRYRTTRPITMARDQEESDD